MTTVETLPVSVIGGGPVGLAAAVHLLARGLAVRPCRPRPMRQIVLFGISDLFLSMTPAVERLFMPSQLSASSKSKSSTPSIACWPKRFARISRCRRSISQRWTVRIRCRLDRRSGERTAHRSSSHCGKPRTHPAGWIGGADIHWIGNSGRRRHRGDARTCPAARLPGGRGWAGSLGQQHPAARGRHRTERASSRRWTASGASAHCGACGPGLCQRFRSSPSSRRHSVDGG